jgi:branched-chain amino acid transport system ATP-binding protein
VILQIDRLCIAFGNIKALDAATLHVERGEILSIIGANGAGKTTLLRAVAGLLRPQSGRVEFEGKTVTGLRADGMVRLGITMVPEGRRVFPHLSVRENLELGAYTLRDKKVKKELFGLAMDTFPRLKERIKQFSGTLSGGEQQMLAMGRALMGNPKLLLLDEPSMGLSPIITREIFSLITRINGERGISMMLVEQNARAALEHSARAYVLENGRVTMSGPSQSLKADPRIVEAYLGL